MNLLAPDCYDSVCGDPMVREQIGSLETGREDAVRYFWTWILAGVLVSAAIMAALYAMGWAGFIFITPFVVMIGAFLIGSRRIHKVNRAIKLPVLQALAARAGLEYMEKGFSPPVYPEAEKALFGGLSSRLFTDLFHGKDDQGKGIALYEAHLVRSSGKSSHTVFQGQVYAVERSRTGGGTTVIVPDRGLFNFIKPKGLERVRFDTDAAFDAKFEVYATGEMEARQLLFDSGFRAHLLALGEAGRVFVFVGPEGALLAATGKDKFEAGSMFSARPAADRIKAMVEDVRAALVTLSTVKAELG
jgi:hypothetical protein